MDRITYLQESIFACKKSKKSQWGNVTAKYIQELNIDMDFLKNMTKDKIKGKLRRWWML